MFKKKKKNPLKIILIVLGVIALGVAVYFLPPVHDRLVTPGQRMVEPIKEALEYYLGYNVAVPQMMRK